MRLRYVPLLTLALCGCEDDDAKACREACDKITACDPYYPCPAVDGCTARTACDARCHLDVSCDALYGVNEGEAARLKCCQQVCATRHRTPGTQMEVPHYFPQSVEKEIDILFVIDNSNSMQEEQANLTKNFPKFIDALRTPALNNRIPNIHIGVVSSDLGAGNYSLPSCEVSGGDGGKLQAQPQVSGCISPSKPYIEYIDGVTNINNPAVTDPVEKVKKAFQCIAELGTGGCGFEYTIESARRALDPKLNRNPGFIRKDAMLAVVFITDEDDCSARKPQLFDPNQNQMSDPLGPLTSFRCFEFGVRCECPGGATCKRTTQGPRTNCKPAFSWLYAIEDYVKFFKGLKSPGRVFMFAIAGPTSRISVGTADNGNPWVEPGCKSSAGKGTPAVRIETVVKAFGDNGHFNEGTDATLTKVVPVDICSDDFTPALRLLGKVITSALAHKCLAAPLTAGGGLVCQKGDLVGLDCEGRKVTCKASCLDRADCTVTEGSTTVQKCDASKFGDPGDKSCGSRCPCWRLVRKSDCTTSQGGLAYDLEILRKGSGVPGGYLKVRCKRAETSTGLDPINAELPQCL